MPAWALELIASVGAWVGRIRITRTWMWLRSRACGRGGRTQRRHRIKKPLSAVVVALEGGEYPRPLLGVKAQGEGDVAAAAQEVFGNLRHGGRRNPRGWPGDTYRCDGLMVFIEDGRAHTANTHFD